MFNNADDYAEACDRYARTLEKCTEAAVWQLALAMRESDGAVERLGAAVARMGDMRPIIEMLRIRFAAHDNDATLSTDFDLCAERLLADLTICIENMQFYDRMVQHLGHLKHYLASISGVLAAPGEVRAEIASLEQANAQFRRRLLTDAQRSVFDHVFRQDSQGELESLAERAAHTRNATDGTIEFF